MLDSSKDRARRAGQSLRDLAHRQQAVRFSPVDDRCVRFTPGWPLEGGRQALEGGHKALEQGEDFREIEHGSFSYIASGPSRPRVELPEPILDDPLPVSMV
jgi:hypothetical protein